MIADIRAALALEGPGALRRWAALLPRALTSAAAEAAGAAAVFGLVRILADPRQATGLPVVSSLLPLLPDHAPRTVLLWLTVLAMLVYLARNAVLALSWAAQERVVFGAVRRTARRVLRAYLEAPYQFLLRRNSAALVQRVQRGAEVSVTLVLASVVHLCSEALVAVALVGLLMTAAPPSTLAVAAATVALLLLPAVLGGRVFRRWGDAEQRLEKELLQAQQQCLGALKEVRLAGQEAGFLEAADRLRAAYTQLQRRRSVLQEVLRLGGETLVVLALLLVVLVLTLQEAGAETLSLLGLYGYAGFRLVPSGNRITRALGCFRTGVPFVRDLHEDLAQLPPLPPGPPASPIGFAGELVLDCVSFEYEPGRPVLQEVALTIRRGESIGLVGPTGSGKTTLADLLLGLLAPTAGRVLADGRDVRENLRSWQQAVGYVPQEPHLLDDTVRCNVAFALDPAQIDDDRVRRALRLAQLEEVLAGLPDGLETRLGERGVRLSGGQRQRIAIARALYRDPAVLVFDEATSALDLETERELTEAIEPLMGERTIIVVAHRPSTVRRCSRLVVLREGRIAATGGFDELVRAGQMPSEAATG
ncbi:MAG: ABC transporter ATP-binding protein [Deltaproteobacteria bacterium]|nr:ABC transporter ATP-binding protein [Deltaproteobacteria bacterium]